MQVVNTYDGSFMNFNTNNPIEALINAFFLTCGLSPESIEEKEREALSNRVKESQDAYALSTLLVAK